MSNAPQAPALGRTYYGTSQFGLRIHFGEIVLFPEANDPEKWVIQAHCGARLTEHDIDDPVPSKVTDYCRSCFRAIAWQAFEASLQSLARSRMREEKKVTRGTSTTVVRSKPGRNLASVV